MKVLFVCTANTCRSPMLEYMFRAYAYARGRKDVEVQSAGMVLCDDVINPMCAKTLDRHGVPYNPARESVFCDRKTFSSAKLVYTMTDEQKDVLAKFYGAKKKIKSLSQIVGRDVCDPYGMGEQAYEDLYRTLNGALGAIFEDVEKTK